MYKDRSGFWASEGLLYYLPREPKLKQIILNTARNRGFGANMPYVLRQLGCSDKEIKPMVSLSLSSKYPATLIEGALAAQVYPNDEHAPKLIAIAMDPNSPARHQAIYAIAWNRTEQGVRALKQLLKDPDKDIRINTDHAIRSAYKRHSNKGRPLRDDDFEEMFRKQKEKKKS
jgi:hypothetical protein